MPGHGPPPKDPGQMANKSRANADKNRMRVVDSAPTPAPELPEYPPIKNPDFGVRNPETQELVEPDAERFLDWPEQTLIWWDSWIHDPLTADYRPSDWLDLLDCAVIHARMWTGEDKTAATELRLRMARHGATREDRARLRITYATADLAERRNQGYTPPQNSGATGSRGRRGGLSSATGLHTA